MSIIPDVQISSPYPPKRSSVKNWADDPAVATRIKNEIIPLLQHIRDRRKPLNDMWNRMFKVWTLEHEEQNYEGRSNIYVPAGKKTAETLVSQLVSGTFPGDDNFGVESRVPEYRQDALGIKTVLQHQVEQVARVRVSAEPFYRQLVMTGNAPVKVFYERRTIPMLKRSRKDFGMPQDSVSVLYDGPVFEPLDICNLYYWPENVNHPRDAEVVFEDLTVSMSQLKRRAREGIYSKTVLGELGGKLRQSAKDHVDQARLSAQGITTPHDVEVSGWGLVDISEVYLHFDPTASDRESEETPVPFLITIAGGEVIRAIENPFWHKRPPYLLGRMGTITGRVYGTGFMETIRELNLLLNDQVNQSMDAATYAINPIFITNPNAVLGALPDIHPGVQFLVNDINQAVKTITPPMEVLQAGSILSSQTMSWIQDFGGAPPVLSGGSAPGRAFRTATGIGTAQRNAVIPLQEIIRLAEADVWEPMLGMFHSLDEQFAEDDYLIFMAGDSKPFRVPPKQLAGEWMFKWLASTQTDNKMVKGSQITELLTILSAPNVQMALQANQMRFNPVPLVRRLYQEVYGFRDVDEVLIQAALGPGGTPGGAGVAPEVGLPGAAPGLEGNEEFQDMRMGADSIAGDLGAMMNQSTGLTDNPFA